MSHIGAERNARITSAPAPARGERAWTDWGIAGALSLAAALARLPYLALVPRFDDEVTETVLALTFRPGSVMPLVGMDAYAQPLFTYVIMICAWLFGPSAMQPRIVIMVMGALTVGLTYGLARASGLGRVWAALAGLLLLTNPHHIVINSHLAGASYTVPFFGTAFLAALTLAARRESGRWLAAAGALAGLAISNPMFTVVLPGAALWFLAQRKSRIGLKTAWPYLSGLAFLLAYSPVIIYNVQNQFEGVGLAGTVRSYIWQPNPTPATWAANFARFVLQLAHQVSGVLAGSESLASLAGLPLGLALWALVGLLLAARRGVSLPLFAVASQAIIMPWFSNHYGVPVATRFTNQLSPLLFVAMATLAGGAWNWAAARKLDARPRLKRLAALVCAALLAVACVGWPLGSLARFYAAQEANGENNRLHFAFADEFMQQWRGEKLVLSLTNWYSAAEYFFAVNRVPYTTMQVGHLLEQLAAGGESGPLIVMLYNDDVAAIRAQTDLIEWQTPAMRAAPDRLGYTLYTIPDAGQVRKPPFVVTDAALAAPDVRRAQATFANPASAKDQLGLVGYRLSNEGWPEDGRLTVNVFWTALAPMPEAYTGFVHLIGPDGQIAAQDDHELGRGVYRTPAWSAGEIIREKYELKIQAAEARGAYQVRAGVYRFPSLTRLAVQSSSLPVHENAVTLATLQAGP